MVALRVTCFTDLQGYSTQEDLLGHNLSQVIVNEFLAIGKALIDLNDGQYVKNIGDAHMAIFDDLESALRFSVELQQYYQEQPCVSRPELRVRVALCLGAVEPVDRDVFGPGVIMAARQESLTAPVQVTANGDMIQQIRRAWGDDRTDQYFRSIGQHDLKGFRQSQELFVFDWPSYAKDNAEATLAERVFRCVESAEVVPSNLSIHDLSPPGLAVWPVVPRSIATAIHRGQLEILRLLALLGWRIHLLVADCGPGADSDSLDVVAFVNAILDHARYRSLCNIETSRLSTYFDVDYEYQGDVLDWFRRITSDLEVQDLIAISQKEYAQGVRDEIRRDSALSFLRPILTCAAVVHLATSLQDIESNPKIIIVCGIDEDIQWSNVLHLTESQQGLGAIYNPTLRVSLAGATHTARQRRDWPIWRSQRQLFNAMGNTNAAKWVFQLFVQLPSFPYPYVLPNRVLANPGILRVSDWGDEFASPSTVDRRRLVRFAWPLLDPARPTSRGNQVRPFLGRVSEQRR